MSFAYVLRNLPPEKALALQPRPYFNHAVELKKTFTAAERAQMLEAVGLNVFYFPAEMVTGCDLLSDSGTTTMTNEQWAALHLGDEAYGSNRGYFLLRDQMRETFGEAFFNNLSGPPNAFIFHQGRPAEDALFSALGRLGQGLIIPSNGHFDTTQANIEVNGMLATNLFAPELTQEDSTAAFKGNIDLTRLQQLLAAFHPHIPVVYLTVTNNTGGGQPVAMQPADFGGVALTAILLAAYGHRAVELGNFAFGKCDPQTGRETFPEVNFVRFAIPRLRYERDDLDAVAEALHLLYERRSEIPPITVTYGKDLPLRHFKAHFAFGPLERGHHL